MLREETEKERGDYRSVKTDGRMINTFHKGLSYSHLGRKYSDNDNKIQRRKEFCTETTDDAEDDDREIDEDQSEGDNVEVQKININKKEEEHEENRDQQKDADHSQLRKSHTNLSQIKDNNRSRVCSRGMYNSSNAMYLQSPARLLEPHRDQWAYNFNRSTPVERNGAANYDAEISDAAVSYVDQGRSDPREQMGNCARQYRLHDCCNHAKKNDESRCTSEIKLRSLASSDCSRRPIRCPRLDCSVNVAFSALTHHFLFDHPEVPILNVEPGAQSTLIVSYEALSCNSSRCLALLLVSGKLSDSAARLFGGNQINWKYRDRLPLPVLAARLYANNRYACNDEVHAGGEGHCERDVIIVWVAGLNSGDDRLRCSIQAVDSIENGGFRSLTYTGPITSLRAAQSPRDVFLAGDCIVLHEGLISHITSGCTTLNDICPFNIDHEREHIRKLSEGDEKRHVIEALGKNKYKGVRG